MRQTFLFSILFFLVEVSSAQVALFVLDRGPDQPRIVFARSANETPWQAIERYVELIRANGDLKKMTPAQFNIESGTIRDLPASSRRPLTALLANQVTDLHGEAHRMRRTVKVFEQARADVYVLPLVGEIGLSATEVEDYRSKISEQFDLLVALGGDDIDPLLYGQEVTHSRAIVPVRDRSELSLVKKFKERAKGVFFGICRGHQMGAIAEGHRIYQDISLIKDGDPEEHQNRSATTMVEAQTWHHIFIEKTSLLARFLRNYIGNDGLLMVNSYHHQSVMPEGNLRVSAFHSPSEIEALESQNGLSISTQWHPEYPEFVTANKSFSDMGSALIQNIVAYARLKRHQMRSLPMCFRLFGT